MPRAVSRTFCTAGSRSPIKIPMIAITTNSSTSVKPDRHGTPHRFCMRLHLRIFDP
jgi:hypothetical protein